MLRVAVTSAYSGLLGSYVLDDDGAVTWEWDRNWSDRSRSFEERPTHAFADRPILARDEPGEWIVFDDDPERFVRRLPGFLAMRGHMTAEITLDT